jgi:hypothetical protein
MPKHYNVKLNASVKQYDINPGDLVALVAGFLVSAPNFTWNTDIATTRADFAAAFAGIASSASDKDQPLDLRDLTVAVCQDGEVEFDATSATYLAGSLLTVKKDTGNALLNVMEATVVTAHALARVSQTVTGTRVRAYLLKTIPKRLASA